MQDVLRHAMARPEKLAPAVRNSLATITLLLEREDWEITRACIEGLGRGRWRVDERVLVALFDAVPLSLKISVLDSLLTQRLRVPTFERMYRTCYRARPASGYWRPILARTLWFFLERNPREASRFLRPMKALIATRDQEVASLSVRLVPFLPRVTQAEVRRLADRCSHRYANLRMNAFNAIRELAKRRDSLETPALADLTAHLECLAKTRGRSDRNKDVRLCARDALRALREL